MTKFFIKDGYGEKGPLTIEELKRLKISRTTFVRRSESNDWFQASNVFELETIFSNSRRGLKIVLLTLLSASIISIVIIAIYKSNHTLPPFDPYALTSESIPPPPTIEFQITKHRKKLFRELLKGCNLSGEKKELVNACNYTNSTLRNKAVSIAGQSAGSFNLGQVCDIFDYCYNNWKYVNDPKGNEVIEYASRTVSNGLNGDCDDFAVLICSMILSIGGEARINYALGSDGGHAFTEINIGKTNSEEIENYISRRYQNVYQGEGIWSRIDQENNKWLNLDWFANHPGGKYFDYTRGTTFYIIQQYCNDFTK